MILFPVGVLAQYGSAPVIVGVTLDTDSVAAGRLDLPRATFICPDARAAPPAVTGRLKPWKTSRRIRIQQGLASALTSGWQFSPPALGCSMYLGTQAGVCLTGG